MIYINTLIPVIDNSGGQIAKCIKILTKSSKSKGTIGDLILVVLKSIKPNKKVKKGIIYKAIIVRSTNKIFRYGVIFIKFNQNGIILLNERMLPLGTRILSVINLELRNTPYFKFASLSSFII